MSLRRSIAVRLTLLFAIVATLVLAALGVAIYVSARHDLVAQDFVELENKVALIRDLADSGLQVHTREALGRGAGPSSGHRLPRC